MLTLRISQYWITKLQDELNKAGNIEIGGILMAEQTAPGNFLVVEMTFQRAGGTIVSFMRNAHHALRALKRFFRRTGHRYTQFNYIGEWHSHPSFSVNPSDRDYSSMTELIDDPEVGADFLLLLIVRLNSEGALDATLTGYQPGQPPQIARLITEA